VGCERELTSGAHVSVRGEREDVEDGRHKSKKKTYFAEYAKGAHGPSGPMKGMVAYGKGMPTWWSWVGWAGPQEGIQRKIYFWISKTFEILARLWEFLQGDLEGILTQRFFLNSSRLLKDF
jgi:hypothetical protein